MIEILTQLIATSIDANKIPSLDCFDMSGRKDGSFTIRLNDGTEIVVDVSFKLPDEC